MIAGKRKVSNRLQIIEFLNSHKARFRSEYAVRNIAIISSFAREERKSQSDMALFVGLEDQTPANYRVMQEPKKVLQAEFGRRVELPSARYEVLLGKPDSRRSHLCLGRTAPAFLQYWIHITEKDRNAR